MSDDMMKNGEKKTFSPLLFFFVGGHHRPCTTIPPNYWSRRLKSLSSGLRCTKMASLVPQSERYKDAVATCSLIASCKDKDMILNLIHTSCDRVVRPKVVDTTVFPLFVVGKSLNSILDAIEYIVCGAIARGLSAKKLSEELADVPPVVATELVKVYQMRGHELVLSRSESVAAISEMFLKDFDWSIRYVMGTSKLSTTRKAILLLTLSLENPNGNRFNKTYEMDLRSLSELLKKFDHIADATDKIRMR